MARNIEIKAVVQNYDRFYNQAEVVGVNTDTIHQVDTYFNCPTGKLKLREIIGKGAEIIFYNRTNQLSPKLSEYARYSVLHPRCILKILSQSFGVRGVITKDRSVFMAASTRIHLDSIPDLGVFAELEVVLSPNQTVKDGERVAFELMDKLGIVESNLVSESYIDMIEKRRAIA